MRYFPVFVDLDGAKVLLVGGGEQAAQKLRLILKTPAAVTVVATAACAEIEAAATAGRLRLERRAFRVQDLEGCKLVFSAVEDAAEAARIAQAARAAGVLLNVVDRQELSSFITPAIVDRDPVVVAIGSEGTGPVLARRIKATIEALLPARLGALARWAGGWRARVADGVPEGPARRRFWEQLFGGEIARAWLAGETERAEALTASSIAAAADDRRPGFVSIVGAGPGDPDLLTFKAMRALQSADVIVVDRLVGPEILERARRDARRIHVGKTPGQPSTEQDEIDRILVEEARAGHHVVRLKGGDPLIFGRVAEELRALEEAGIGFELVPGITAALACAASVGLPLTEREARRALTLMTGHATDGAAEHDWQALARPGQMVAIYMGVGAASHIEARLRDAGIDPGTPVTIVENGTLPGQKVALGTADTIVLTLIDHGIKGPAIIFIGAHPLSGTGAAPSAGVDQAAWLGRPQARPEEARC